MIQFSDRQVSYKQFLEDVSKAVAKKLRGDITERMLTTKEAAAFCGVTPDYLRHLKDKLGAEKRGEGKQARLMWSIENLKDWRNWQ